MPSEAAASPDPLPPLAEHVNADGGHDDEADEDLLDVVGYPEDVAPVPEDAHEESPDDGPPHSPFPPLRLPPPITAPAMISSSFPTATVGR